MDKFEAVVFDLDGTLLDTIEDLTDSVNAALQQYSCPLKTVDQVRSYVGNGIRNLMIRCIGQGERHPEFENIYRAFLEHYKVNCKEFQMVAIGERDGIARKPAPDSVFAALRELDVPAGKAVYVGDSDVDVETARNAGIPCISVLWGFREKDVMLKCGAKYFAEDADGLLAVLKELEQV